MLTWQAPLFPDIYALCNEDRLRNNSASSSDCSRHPKRFSAT